MDICCKAPSYVPDTMGPIRRQYGIKRSVPKRGYSFSGFAEKSMNSLCGMPS
nr:MAG TPA: hypothetical protein [Caudoviricetes sp.]DAN06987.1 MAG TPA: hypothetical protein [Caudoviricetes sp.]